jgi:2'-5' RNA ligase
LPIAGKAQIVPLERFHITLAYLGERDANHLPALSVLLNECAALFVPFTLSSGSAAYFKKPENATVYAAVEPSEPLSRLCERLRASLEAAGETFDRSPFIPHITLAHHASLCGLPRPLTAAKRPNPIRFQANGLTLFHSVRTDGALHYHPLHTASLNTIVGGFQ